MKVSKTIWKLLLLSFISFQAFSQPLPTADPASQGVDKERLLRIDNLLQTSIKKQYMHGAIALIARNGKIVYNSSYGYSDFETKKILAKTDIFRIASQTKAITSVAVMMLFEEGKILLDDPISKYIPSFAKPLVLDTFISVDNYTTHPAKREITIRDLLTHTSGIDYAVIGSANMKQIYAKAGIPVGFESGRLLLKDAIPKLGTLPLAHEPGARFTYGLSVDVLGYLVEVVSGKSLSEFFKERIFTPLMMNDTYFYLPKENRRALYPSIHFLPIIN
ncbi:Beta-lactamase class C and other penicillin binding protein [Arcticibacter svalbardensis MN12-7]|uniref:Beta-lactamase class C and other penicillin binding protein n=1 Tax=Arcticibacter svalbardensis MN12-7 TaxID=1150600 RepID=R9GYD9_9SPHI|nr:serine hydrolase domain-containing protein [Arcticibacter svalbardensis]EOR96520.1 Beta-lactamase class C and other penicillin binding protein [Arcticibacter svalbardensis MN12-7]